jgi:alpha-amylase
VVARASSVHDGSDAPAVEEEDANSVALDATAKSSQQSTALATTGEAVTTTFTTHYETSYGQVLRIVGALEELGAWQPDKAPAMTWTDGHVWTLDAALPPGANVEFKVVMTDADGRARWCGGH